MRFGRGFAFPVLLLLCATFVLAQAPSPKYDLSSETKIKGTVQEIKDLPGKMEGRHLVIKTGDESVLVQLAPTEFLDMMGYQPKVGDTVTVTGSKITNAEGAPEVLARLLEDESKNVITFRDTKGGPAWTWMKIKE